MNLMWCAARSMISLMYSYYAAICHGFSSAFNTCMAEYISTPKDGPSLSTLVIPAKQ